jgi:hypothetical protein
MLTLCDSEASIRRKAIAAPHKCNTYDSEAEDFDFDSLSLNNVDSQIVYNDKSGGYLNIPGVSQQTGQPQGYVSKTTARLLLAAFAQIEATGPAVTYVVVDAYIELRSLWLPSLSTGATLHVACYQDVASEFVAPNSYVFWE